MQTVRRPTEQFALRLGRAAGRSARWLKHRERQAIGWLVAEGLPAPVAAALLWIVKLVVVAGLLYTAFWLALLVTFAIIAAWAAMQNHSEEKEFELQFPTLEELRNSPGYDPNLYNDTSHEMYHDERD